MQLSPQRRHDARGNGGDRCVYMSIHKAQPPQDILPARLFGCVASLPGGIVPKPIATGILTLIERLRPEDGMGPVELAIPPTDHDSGWCGRAVRVGAAVRLLPSGATAAMEPLRPNRLTHSDLTWRAVARKCRPPYIPVPWP